MRRGRGHQQSPQSQATWRPSSCNSRASGLSGAKNQGGDAGRVPRAEPGPVSRWRGGPADGEGGDGRLPPDAALSLSLVPLQTMQGRIRRRKPIFIFHSRSSGKSGGELGQELGLSHQESMWGEQGRVTLGPGDLCLSRVLTCPDKGQMCCWTEAGAIPGTCHLKTILRGASGTPTRGSPVNPGLGTHSCCWV